MAVYGERDDRTRTACEVYWMLLRKRVEDYHLGGNVPAKTSAEQPTLCTGLDELGCYNTMGQYQRHQACPPPAQ